MSGCMRFIGTPTIARALNAIMAEVVVTQSLPEAAETLQKLTDRIIAARSTTPIEQVGRDNLALVRWMNAPFLH